MVYLCMGQGFYYPHNISSTKKAKVKCMSKVEEIFSAGIDIGTSTTTVVISKLKIKNVASGFVVPKIEIIDKAVIYRSDVYFTPLLDETTIDFKGIEEIVKKEYERAKVSPDEIKTGAVIITGDTARKENAQNVLEAISKMAGSFVVATAGPHLEAYIAGLGSGAATYSNEKHVSVSNADVGGGTSNIAVFDDGKLKATLCADIGGRLIRFEPWTYKVQSFIRGGEVTANYLGIKLEKGKNLLKTEIFAIAEALSQALISIILGNPNELAQKLAIGDLSQCIVPKCIMFSGGVGRLIYEEEPDIEEGSITRFGDLGPALAAEIKNAVKDTSMKLVKPAETIYATVIGAGIHTTELSGSTIYVSDPEVLPFRDLPAIYLTASDDLDKISAEIVSKAEKFSVQDSKILPAIVIPKAFGNSFAKIKELTQAIENAARRVAPKSPIVVICEDDIGKAVGNLLRNNLSKPRPVISIDQLTMKEGDYIDIGKPLYDGGVVPVVIKTLVFSNS